MINTAINTKVKIDPKLVSVKVKHPNFLSTKLEFNYKTIEGIFAGVRHEFAG